MVLLNETTGEVIPARCGINGCPYCVRGNAHRRTLARIYARPTRELRISLVADPGDPDPWPTVRYRVNKTRENLIRFGMDPGEWSYDVETNPQETGYHAHLLQHGPKLDKDALDQASFRAGAGLTRVRQIRNLDSAGSYGLKGASTYGLKGARDSADEYLRINGGRLGHHSRGFFRNQEGHRLGVRDAEVAAIREMFGESQGTWTLCHESALPTLASLGPKPTTSAPALRRATAARR
jgi:hypothetical protein